jgi:hypothetical protein
LLIFRLFSGLWSPKVGCRVVEGFREQVNFDWKRRSCSRLLVF